MEITTTPPKEEKNVLEKIVTNMVLYHGSATGGITVFTFAEEETIGSGVYLTTQNVAEGYARIRARNRGGQPYVYSASVSGRFIDLRDTGTLDYVMEGFGNEIAKKLQGDGLKWHQREAILRACADIKGKRYSAENIRLITWSLCKSFTSYLTSLGYDGLLAIEGGEGDIGNHDTWLVFDPTKPTIINCENIRMKSTNAG